MQGQTCANIISAEILKKFAYIKGRIVVVYITVLNYS